jgi:hypothetical protein
MVGVWSGRVGVNAKGILIIIILIIHLTGSLVAPAFASKKSLATSSAKFRQKILKHNLHLLTSLSL